MFPNLRKVVLYITILWGPVIQSPGHLYQMLQVCPLYGLCVPSCVVEPYLLFAHQWERLTFQLIVCEASNYSGEVVQRLTL